jgi:thioredoxin-like negative regulator of GroEL
MPRKGECTVVYIGGTLCRPCELLKPVINELGKSLEGRAKVVSMLLNDSNKKAYKIELIPTIAIFDNNAREVARRIISEEEVPGVPAWIDGVLKGLGK